MTVDIRVVAAVIERNGRYLVCRRPAHKRHGGRWEFPGGKVEDGESDLEAVRRELAEELRLDVRAIGAIRFTLRDPDSPFVIHFAEVDAAGEPVCLEHTALMWATPEEVCRLPLAPSDRQFAEHLARTLPLDLQPSVTE
jgi:mutator protein MutT